MLTQPSRTAVYGPVRTVVWQGSAGNRCPYADQVDFLGSGKESLEGSGRITGKPEGTRLLLVCRRSILDPTN
jgi:hypothetical protein